MGEHIQRILDFSGTAIDLFRLFKNEKNIFFLDSSDPSSELSRYSFIGFSPFDICSARGKGSLDILKKKYSRYYKKGKKREDPFRSGIVGFLSYDLGLSLENITACKKDDPALPDCWFGFYDTVITIDHKKKKLIISSNGLPERTDALRQKRAQKRISGILSRITGRRVSSEPQFLLNEVRRFGPHVRAAWKSDLSKKEYFRAVEKALDYIREGDIYQVNLAQRFSFRPANGKKFDPVELYIALRELSPSSFSGYMDCGEFQIISSSPERFLSCHNGVVETRPMKGTRPRGKDTRTDRRERAGLVKSRKDRAELLMITDLERNDLGRVCRFGSVRVKDMRTVEEYRTVFQTTSTIEGILDKGKDCFDLLRACFPGGSITGCPKIRAMEIIEELEPVHRSIYTGALGYISFSGDMDMNILIRTLLSYQNNIYYHVGGGIVSDSTPENEYQETLVKAQALNECLEQFLSKK